MISKTGLLALFAGILISSVANAQFENKTESGFSLSELRSNAIVEAKREINLGDKLEAQVSKKSPVLAFAYSLLLPGAGHWYIDRMDVGKYFLTADAISWTGLISLNIYGDNVIDDAESYSVEHAEVTDPSGKDEDFFANVGNYNSVYEYNNDKLSRGEYSMLYNVSTQFWNWDAESNRDVFEAQRKKSERIYNNRIIFGSLLIANRVVSGISAYLIANNMNNSRKLTVVPNLLYKNGMSIDGIEFKFAAKF